MIIHINGLIISDNEKWIYDLFGIAAICPSDIHRLLTDAGNKAVTVKINSDGGDVFAASEIYEALREYEGNLTIKIVGVAASAASVIACAGDSEITPTGMLMIHNVSSYARGDYHAMDKQSETLRKANEAIAAAYVEKTGKSLDELLALMDKETWMTAQDAVEYGFVDKISKGKAPTVKLAAAYNNGLLPASVINKMQNQRARERMQAQLDLLILG